MTKTKKTYYHLIPLVLILTVIPLLSRAYQYDPKLSQFTWYPQTTSVYDFYIYYKSQLFIITAAAMAFLIIGKLFIAEKKPYTPLPFIPLAIYAGLALLSSIFSSYRSFSFSGIYEHFESIWVLLGYGIAAYYAYLYVEDEQDIHFLIRCFMIGIFLMVCLGLSQAFKHDFFQTSLGRKILTPDPELQQALTFNFGPGRVYMSLYNPNYVGYYAALIIPVLLSCVLFYKPYSSTKKERIIDIIEIIICIFLSVGLFYCLIKSQAKNGIISLSLALFCMMIISLWKFKKYWYVGIIALAVMIGGFFYADKALNYAVTNSVKTMLSSQKATYPLERITLSKDNVRVTYKGNDILFRINEEAAAFLVTDDNDNPLPVSEIEEYTYHVDDERFTDLTFTFFPVENHIAIGLRAAGNVWYFANGEDSYLYRNPFGHWVTFETAESVLFTGREKIASGRGYIWSRTIPLLKKYLILGSGADTFSIAFPNDDYVGMFNSGYFGMTMTKPHNLYLQIGVQTGVLSLIAFLVFYILYFISSCKIYFKTRLDSYSARIGLGIFIGSIGYMISGIINDSTITVAPIYWALIGLGIGINLRLSNQLKQSSEAAAKS